MSLGVKSEDPRVKLFLPLLDKDMVKLLLKDWVVKNFKGTAIWRLYHDVNSDLLIDYLHMTPFRLPFVSFYLVV